MTRSGLLRRCLLLACALGLSSAARPASAQLVPASWLPAAARGTLAADACRTGTRANQEWIDRVERALFRGVCASARWFDGFFGDRRLDDEATRAWGRLSVDGRWSRHDDLELRPRFRARFPLPNLKNRFAVVVGRDTDDELLAERSPGPLVSPAFLRDGDEEKLFAGLGWTPVRTARQRFGLGVGVKGGMANPEAFVAGRYRFLEALGERGLLRLSPSVFWQSRDGFGGTLGLDLERAVGRRGLLRWSSLGLRSEVTEGLWWQSRVTFFQSLRGQRALAWEARAEGETAAAVALREVLLTATYRQRLWRDWFFGEALVGVSWQRERPEEKRSASAVVGLGFELFFGSRK